MIHTNYLQSVKLLKDAYQIIREEGSEIIELVAADSTQVPEPGIPHHIPNGIQSERTFSAHGYDAAYDK